MYYICVAADTYDGYLMHHGVKGQKWGVRRYQDESGELTPEGREHYGKGLSKLSKSYKEHNLRSTNKKLGKLTNTMNQKKSAYESASRAELDSRQSYFNSVDRLNATKSKLNRAENGLTAKLIGENPRKVRKLQDKIAAQERLVDEAATKKANAEEFLSRADLSYKQSMADVNNMSRKLSKKTNRYIRQYGSLEYDKLGL